MLDNDLDMFTGTENWTKHQFGALLFTDGIKHLREAANCFWLVDAIASHQSDALDKKADGFQLWLFESNGKGGGTLTCRADTGTKPFVTQEIEFTDFPFDQFREPLKLYVEGVGRPQGMQVSGRVLLLPSER